jgi:hypothetical protein
MLHLGLIECTNDPDALLLRDKFEVDTYLSLVNLYHKQCKQMKVFSLHNDILRDFDVNVLHMIRHKDGVLVSVNDYCEYEDYEKTKDQNMRLLCVSVLHHRFKKYF